MRTRSIGWSLTVVIALYTGCARPGPSEGVDLVWKRHEATIERALRGDFQEQPLMAAVSFLEETSGIESPGGLDCKALVVVPTPALAEDLRAWRAWYGTHGRDLYVDAGSGALKRRAGPSR